MPHAKEAAGSAIAAIASTEPIRAVVDLWNTWVAAERICENLRRFGAEEGRREADLITKELREIASGAVRSSLEKLTPFRKELSSFSYLRDRTVGLSQGAPVAIPGSVEGDVNATMIAGTHMVGAIFTSLGLGEYAVPIFGREEGRIFLDIVTEKWHKCKV